MITLCLLLAACCDLRLSVDGPVGPNAFTPTVVGEPTFVLEVYEYSNFDMAHADLGQRFITMRDGELKPLGGNYARSLILKAGIGTSLKVTTANGHAGLGLVGQNRELKIADLCKDNPDGSYKTDGRMSCNVTAMQISATSGP